MGSCSLDRKLVLPDRIELSTSPLPMECSTTELRQHARYPGNRPKRPPLGGRFLPQGPLWRKHAGRPERAQNRQKCWACCRQAASTRSNRRETPKISQRQRGSRPPVADIRSARIIASGGLAASWVIAAGGGETHYAHVMGAAGDAVPGSIKTCSTERQ